MAPLIAPTIVIRPAYADDAQTLMRLATLDSADRVPAEPLLLAEVDGELRAALSLHDGSVIADPFAPTQALIELLRTHAASRHGVEDRSGPSDLLRAWRRNRSRRRRRRPLLVG